MAHFTPSYFALSENWIHTQIASLRAWTPFVLANRTANLDTASREVPVFALQERPIPVVLLNRVVERVVRVAPSFWLHSKRNDASVIHAHFGPGGVRMLPLARSLNVPLITSFYGYDLSLLPQKDPMWRARYRPLFEEGAAFLVEGNHMKRQLAALGCDADRIVVQHLGVDVGRFALSDRNLPSGEPLRILAAGRFVEKKGFRDAIEAFAAFLRLGGTGKLTIVGDAANNPASLEIKRGMQEMVNRQGIEKHVDFLGMVPLETLRNLYGEHHVFLSPSIQAADGDNEGGVPVTIVEAAATGMTVVATKHCDIPEVVLDGVTGLLAPEKDVDTMAAHLFALWSKPELLPTYGAAAGAHIRREYDAAVQGGRLDGIYDNILRRWSRG